MTARVEVNSASEFEVRLQEQELSDGVHLAETISYFAMEPGAGATGGLHYDAGDFVADQGGQFVEFDPGVKLSSADSFFATMQTFNGLDTTTLRNTVLSAVGANVFTEEERSSDSEISHADETIGFFAINSGIVMGSVLDSTLLGDVNLDGEVNFLDISPFIDRLSNGSFQSEADINQDGEVNFLDIGFFVDLLSGS